MKKHFTKNVVFKDMERIDQYFNDFKKNRIKNVDEYFTEYFDANPCFGKLKFDIVYDGIFSLDKRQSIIMLNNTHAAMIAVCHTANKRTVQKFLTKGLHCAGEDEAIDLGTLAKFCKRFYTTFFKNYFNIEKVCFGLAAYQISKKAQKLADESGLLLFSRPQETVRWVNSSDFTPKQW